MAELKPPPIRGLNAITGAMALIVVLLMVQIWLLTATLQAYLSGDRSAALPATVFSGVIFVACVALYVFVDRLDSQARSDRS
jgi:predicted Co/Zn/Cd cation transporter (cation efflux family)